MHEQHWPSRRRRVRTIFMVVIGAVIVAAIERGTAQSKNQNVLPAPTYSSTENILLPIVEGSSQPRNPHSRTLIARISVPTANIQNLGVTLGTDQTTLGTGLAGAYPWSGPGQTGRWAMAGHRIGAGGPFRNLDEVKVGDAILVSANLMKYTYRVTSVREVEPTDLSVLDGSADNAEIVLITCTPISTFSKRLIVTGVLEN